MFAWGRHGESSLRFRPSLRGRRLFVVLGVVTVILAGAAVAIAAPEYVQPPEVTGKEKLGERLVCYPGSWKGSPNFTYVWLREGVEFASGPSYKLTSLDEHKEVWCAVTATSG